MNHDPIRIINLNLEAKTALIEVNGVQREVRISIWGDKVTLDGLAARIGRTGEKVWMAEAVYWPATGSINNVRVVNRDRMNQRGLRLVGFWDDVKEAQRSKG